MIKLIEPGRQKRSKPITIPAEKDEQPVGVEEKLTRLSERLWSSGFFQVWWHQHRSKSWCQTSQRGCPPRSSVPPTEPSRNSPAPHLQHGTVTADKRRKKQSQAYYQNDVAPPGKLHPIPTTAIPSSMVALRGDQEVHQMFRCLQVELQLLQPHSLI